jgi:hypothetical protein
MDHISKSSNKSHRFKYLNGTFDKLRETKFADSY